MARLVADATVTVVIQRGHVVYVDGVSYGEAQTVNVSEAEAKHLTLNGQAKRVRKQAA